MARIFDPIDSLGTDPLDTDSLGTKKVDDSIRILFLMAEPSNLTKLRLAEELREVQEKFQRSKHRERFRLESRGAVRPGDITQAIFDVEPQIVHFSGHGSSLGELCFENASGTVHAVSPEALKSLFTLVSKQVQCVVINACHSEVQARAIAEEIDYVIGMNKEIGDKAAISFSVGFYRALGANYVIDKAFKFGCAEIQMEGIPEHTTPVLYKKEVKPRAGWQLTLEITLDELSNQQIEAIVNYLRGVSGDVSLKLKRIERGSVKLTLEGSQDGFERIKTLIESGQLNEIFDIPIQSLHKKADVPAKEPQGVIRSRVSPDRSYVVSRRSDIICCYVNPTKQVQVVRITNVLGWYFERVVFPGHRLVFEAVTGAILEICTGTTSSAILFDTIPCNRLRIEADLQADFEIPSEDYEQFSQKGGWVRRTED